MTSYFFLIYQQIIIVLYVGGLVMELVVENPKKLNHLGIKNNGFIKSRLFENSGAPIAYALGQIYDEESTGEIW